MSFFNAIGEFLIHLFIYGSVGLVIFAFISIAVFMFTGKSLLYRMVESRNREREEEAAREAEALARQQIETRGNIKSQPLPIDNAHLDMFDRKNKRAVGGLPARLARFRKDVEAGRVPSLESMLRTRSCEVVNPVPYFVHEYLEAQYVRLVSRIEPQPQDSESPLSPWFVFDSPEEPTLQVFDPGIVEQYDLFALLMQGWYEKPRMKTITRCLQQRYSADA